MKPVNPTKNPKLEEYELDNHLKSLLDAQKIASDPKLLSAVNKHAKKKKMEMHKASKMLMSHSKEESMESPEDDMLESSMDEAKEVKSIEDIRKRKRKIKSKMMGE